MVTKGKESCDSEKGGPSSVKSVQHERVRSEGNTQQSLLPPKQLRQLHKKNWMERPQPPRRQDRERQLCRTRLLKRLLQVQQRQVPSLDCNP